MLVYVYYSCYFTRKFKIKLEVFIEHIPRADHERLQADACSAATIDVTSLPMRIEQGGYRVYCVRVRVRPYPRCGSDRLPYIQHNYIVKLSRLSGEEN